MNITDAYKLGRFLMREHGLGGWTLQIIHSLHLAGECIYPLVIRLNGEYVEKNSEAKVRDTILREIAHALCPRQHHNEVWRAKCRELGCTPSPYVDEKAMPDATDDVRLDKLLAQDAARDQADSLRIHKAVARGHFTGICPECEATFTRSVIERGKRYLCDECGSIIRWKGL